MADILKSKTKLACLCLKTFIAANFLFFPGKPGPTRLDGMYQYSCISDEILLKFIVYPYQGHINHWKKDMLIEAPNNMIKCFTYRNIFEQ